VLNETLFRSLPHARAVLETWRHDYNPTSSHPSLYAIEEKGFC
jgi:putative transposase